MGDECTLEKVGHFNLLFSLCIISPCVDSCMYKFDIQSLLPTPSNAESRSHVGSMLDHRLLQNTHVRVTVKAKINSRHWVPIPRPSFALSASSKANPSRSKGREAV